MGVRWCRVCVVDWVECLCIWGFVCIVVRVVRVYEKVVMCW